MNFKPVVTVNKLKKSYGNVEALKGISLELMPGEIVGLLGPNGAGKSTFFSVLSTISQPSSGQVFINGISSRKKNAKKFIGYVPQEIALYPTVSGMDNLVFWADMYRIEAALKKPVIDRLVNDFELSDIIRRKVETYSGGMKRRLNIAAGMLHNPMLLIMDEPFVGVDIASKRKILDIMLKLKSGGSSIIFSSHSLDEVEKTCDRIILLEGGSIKAIGTLDELLQEFSASNLEDILLGTQSFK